MFVRTSSDLESNVVSVERTKEYAEVEREVISNFLTTLFTYFIYPRFWL